MVRFGLETVTCFDHFVLIKVYFAFACSSEIRGKYFTILASKGRKDKIGQRIQSGIFCSENKQGLKTSDHTAPPNILRSDPAPSSESPCEENESCHMQAKRHKIWGVCKNPEHPGTSWNTPRAPLEHSIIPRNTPKTLRNIP